MGRAAAYGALAGGLLGLVVSQLLGLVVIGTEAIDGIADADDLPGLYVVAGVVGLVLGAVYGAITVMVGLAVARGGNPGPTPVGGRRRGALVAGGVAGVLAVISPAVLFGPLALVGWVLLGLVGGATTYAVLPRLLVPTGGPDRFRLRGDDR